MFSGIGVVSKRTDWENLLPMVSAVHAEVQMTNLASRRAMLLLESLKVANRYCWPVSAQCRALRVNDGGA